MKVIRLLAVTVAGLMVVEPAWSQSNDTASERSRLANQRIQLEMERRKRAEEELRKKQEEIDRLEQAVIEEQAERQRILETRQPASASRPARQPALPPEPAPAPAPAPADKTLGMPRSLEQIKMLGELKDAGYVTDDEFERIKKRLLEGEL